MGIINNIIAYSIAPISPPVALYLSKTQIIPEEIETGILTFAQENLNPFGFFESITSAIFSPLVEIWNFVLYNILTPFLVIVLTIMFFVGQYYLIKIYVIAFKFLVENVSKIIAKIMQNEKIKILFTNLTESLSIRK